MGSNDSDQEVTNSQEYKTLSTHLSNDSGSLTTTLDSFCKPTEENFMKSQSASEVESQLWRVWKAITTIATQTAHDSPGRQKLADNYERVFSYHIPHPRSPLVSSVRLKPHIPLVHPTPWLNLKP